MLFHAMTTTAGCSCSDVLIARDRDAADVAIITLRPASRTPESFQIFPEEA
jgi:hypothetical protein